MDRRAWQATVHGAAKSWTQLSDLTFTFTYDYTVEMRNKFKGLDLIECLMNYGRRFMTLYRRKGSRPSPKKKWRKGKIYPFECRVPKNSKDR